MGAPTRAQSPIQGVSTTPSYWRDFQINTEQGEFSDDCPYQFFRSGVERWVGKCYSGGSFSHSFSMAGVRGRGGNCYSFSGFVMIGP